MLGSLFLGLKADASFAVSRAKRSIIAGVVAGFFLFVAYIAGMVALAFKFAETHSAAAAVGLVCLINVILAIIVIIVLVVRNRMERRRRLMTSLRVQAAAQQQSAMLVNGVLNKHPIMGVLGVAALTFIAGKVVR